MNILKKISLNVIVLLLSQYGLSQQTKFAPDGKIIELSFNKNKIDNTSPGNISYLDSISKATARTALKEKIDKTIKNLKDPTTGLESFYNWLWGNAEDILKDLQSTSNALDTSNVDTKLTYSLFDKMNKIIKTKLFNDVSYKLDSSEINKLSLIHSDPYNNFLVNYYNSSYSTAGRGITSMNLESWFKYSNYLSLQKNLADSLLKVVYDASGEMSIPLFQKIREVDRALKQGNSLFSKSKALMQDSWFKDWIWIQEGAPRLNPMDFTTDAFLAKNPEYSLEKSKIYDEYIDTAIKRFIRYDTSAKFDQFKKLLAEKGKGSDLFKLNLRQDEIAKNNERMMQQIVTKKTLNEVSIPNQPTDGDPSIRIVDTELMTQHSILCGLIKNKTYRTYKTYSTFHNTSFSPLDKFKATSNNTGYLNSPIRTSERKTIAVHNIKQGQDVYLKTKETPIADRSAFQDGVDTIASFAMQIASLVTKLSPYGIMNPGGFIKPNNLTITPPISWGGNSMVTFNTIDLESFSIQADSNIRVTKRTYESIKIVLKKALIKAKKYDEEIFNTLIARMASDTHNFINTEQYSKDAAHDDTLNKIKDIYFEILKEQEELFFRNLSKDSLNLAFMQAAFSNSSLPPAKLKGKTDNTPSYYSKILIAQPVDQAVKNDVTIVGFKSKTDSITVAKFSYDVGKTYRFQLSTGIAYTFGNFIQSTAKEENGKVTIENTAQYYRLVAGLHIHLGDGLFLQDNRFGGRFWERSSVYIGVGIPKPLENIYLGVAYDFFPGLKTTVGFQLYRNNEYLIQNNTIVEDRTKYKLAAPFLAVQIDPSSLLKALNVIK